MNLELYNEVVLRCDIPLHNLKIGDIVKLVDRHLAPDGTEGYSIEVFNAIGTTIAVTTVPATAIESLQENEIFCVRAFPSGSKTQQDRLSIESDTQ